MKCNCSIGNIVLAAIILIFALRVTTYSQWIIIIASVLLIIHELWHKHKWTDMPERMPAKRKR